MNCGSWGSPLGPCTFFSSVVWCGMARTIDTLRLSRLVPALRAEFGKVPDQRNSEAPDFVYPMPDVLMAGFAMMMVQDPSMLEFQRRLQERRRGNNLKTLFGVGEVPEQSQFRRILDAADPDALQASFELGLQRLQKTRLWPGFRVLGGRYAALLDGFEYFRSNRKGCDHCLEFHHRDVVWTMLIKCSPRPLPILPPNGPSPFFSRKFGERMEVRSRTVSSMRRDASYPNSSNAILISISSLSVMDYFQRANDQSYTIFRGLLHVRREANGSQDPGRESR